MNIKNNLTFAIIIKDGNWKADLTIRFCEYYSHKLNGEDFISKIIFASTVDEALYACNTDYLLIQREGNIASSDKFFSILEDCSNKKTDLFLGHVELIHDYLIVHDTCLFVNMVLWQEVGKPSFNFGSLSEGPKFIPSNISTNKYIPGLIEINSSDTENCFVPSICKSQGSDFAVKQLNLSNRITCISGIASTQDNFYFNSRSQYQEIYWETYFDKINLHSNRQLVFLKEDDDMSNLKNITADIVVAVAQGLKPLNLAEYYKAKELIIFDINPLALQFQKKLFSIASPTIYGEVVEEFLNEHPDITVAGNWRQDYYCIVKPVPNLNIRYEVVDVISFEMENFLRTINHERSTVFDFSDIFVYPFNFYHKNLLQVKALFTEIYSQIKSRSGPTHIMGFAPDFKGMHLDEINTSRISYELDPNLPPMDDDVELTQEMLDMDEYIESKSDVIVDANDPPKPSFDDALVHQYVKTSKIEKLTDRYVEVTIYSKIEKLQDFDAIFEYIVYPDNKWDFKVGKVGLDKRVSFMLGPDLKTFLNHLNKQLKINPKTAVKHFIGN